MLRQLNGIVAGAAGMDWRLFLPFNALGGALWVLLWTLIGFYLGKHGAEIAALIHKTGLQGGFFVWLALIVVLTYVAGHNIVRRWGRNKAEDSR